MAKGNLIFLNGVSSSGKTLIAKALQEILDEPYLHFCVDSFLMMLPDQVVSGENQEALPEIIPNLVSGMHRCIAASASAGDNIIVDHVLQAQQWLRACVNLLAGFPVLFVGAHCPLEELERRERERDREQGLARFQFDIVHAHGVYDVGVDSSIHSPKECALQIKDGLGEIHASNAFAELKEALASESA